MKQLLLGFVITTALGWQASAAPISPGGMLDTSDFTPPAGTFDGALDPGESFTFLIEPTEMLIFDGSVAGTGDRSDLDLVEITVNGNPTSMFETIEADDPDPVTMLDPGTGTGSFLIEQFMADGNFGIVVALPSGATDPVSIAFSGEGSAISPVPLPAAAWFLISGIAGLGAMRYRQRATQA